MSHRPGRGVARRAARRTRKAREAISPVEQLAQGEASKARGVLPLPNRAERRRMFRELRAAAPRPVVGGVRGGRMAAHHAFAQRGTVGRAAKRAKIAAARERIVGGA